MTSSATGGHLYYILRSRLDPTTYKPGITNSMGRRLRQHGGQERWEVVGVFDLGSRKAYIVKQLILQRFSHCCLNASGEYLKLTDGELQELLKVVSEATSKRYEPKAAEQPETTPESEPPKPRQPESEPEPASQAQRKEREKEWKRAQDLHQKMQDENEREMWRARSPYNNSNPAASRSAPPVSEQEHSSVRPPQPATAAESMKAAAFFGACLALAIAAFASISIGLTTSYDEEEVAQPTPAPQVDLPPPAKVETQPTPEELRDQEIIRKGEEAALWAIRNRSWCHIPISGGWKVTGPVPHANATALCEEAAGLIYQLNKLRIEQFRREAPQTLTEDLARPIGTN